VRPPLGERYIAYAAGGAFQNIVLSRLLPGGCAYVVDRDFAGDAFAGIEVRRPDALDGEDRNVPIVLFTMSSSLFWELRGALVERGFAPERIFYYGDLFFDGLRQRLRGFGVELDRGHYDFVQTTTALLGIDNHSSSLGSALVLALLAATRDADGAAAELGVFRGGNALAVCLGNLLLGHRRRYYLIDSFAGFPELSEHDPAAAAGMFRDTSYEDIRATFSRFPSARVLRGNVPEILAELDEPSYSFVYYDCDLHDPARATLDYFWPRLATGGYVLIHDYLPKRDGFDGVRLAVDGFLDGRTDFDSFEVPETTHLILRKQA
jgi:hypothetical protein